MSRWMGFLRSGKLFQVVYHRAVAVGGVVDLTVDQLLARFREFLICIPLPSFDVVYPLFICNVWSVCDWLVKQQHVRGMQRS